MTDTKKPSTLSAAQIEAAAQFAYILKLLSFEEERLGHFEIHTPTQGHDDTVRVVVKTKANNCMQLEGTMVLKKQNSKWQLYCQASEITNGCHRAACAFDYGEMVYTINRGPVDKPFWEQLRVSVVTESKTIHQLD